MLAKLRNKFSLSLSLSLSLYDRLRKIAARKNASKFVPSQRTPARPMTSIFGWCSAFKTRPEVSSPLRDRLFEVQPVTMSYYSRTAHLMQPILRLVFVVLGRLRFVFFLFFPLLSSRSRAIVTLARGSRRHVLRRTETSSFFLSLALYFLYLPTFSPSVLQKACKVSRGAAQRAKHSVGKHGHYSEGNGRVRAPLEKVVR